MSAAGLLDAARQFQRQNRPADAEQACRALLAAEPAHREALELLTWALVQRGELHGALDALEALTRAWPADPRYLTKQAELALRTGEIALARAAYERLTVMHPGVPLLRYLHAKVLTEANAPRAALAEYARALELGIDQAEETLVCMAHLHSALHESAQAEVLLQRAIERKPDYVPALFNLATLVEERGERAEALALYERVIALDPGFEQVFARVAHLRRFERADDPLIGRMLAELESPALSPGARESLHYGLGKAYDDCAGYAQAFHHYRAANALSSARVPPYDPAAHERFIDAIIAQCSRRWFERVAPVADASPVFICGMFRSGTTLIEQVLGSHPAITTGGELPYFARRVGADIVPYPDALAGVAPAVLQALGRGYLDYLHEAFPGAARVTDKRPDNFLYLGLIKALFPRARIVHANRNVLDNALSVWFQNLDARFNYANELRHIVHYHAQLRRLMTHWGTLFGADILEVNYDRFVADQRAQTERLLDFCGLDWTDAALDFHARASTVRTASLWQVRQPLYQRSSGRWRHYRDELGELLDYLRELGLAEAAGDPA